MLKQVLVTATDYSRNCAAAKALLEQKGFTILENNLGRPMTFAEREPYFPQICAVIAGVDQWDEAVFSRCPNLKVIARFGVGVDNIDLEAAKRHGIQVVNARGGNADSVAEMAVCGILCMLRNAVNLDRSTREGKWERFVGRTLRGKRVGLLGFGAVAQYLAKLLYAFDTELVAYDIYQDQEAAQRLHTQFVPLDVLLESSDIVSLHLPCLPSTVGLINAQALARMKPNAILVNTARGPIVDETALLEALKSHSIYGAVLDVYGKEPTDASNPLFQLDNVVVFPHTAAETYETYHSIGMLTAQAVLDVIDLHKPPANWLNK